MRNRNLVVFGLVIIAVVILTSGVWFYFLRGTDGVASISVEAYEQCKSHMTGILDDPDSARFDPYEEDFVSASDERDRYQVTSIVDAENNAGETISTLFLCVLEYDADSDEWTLVNLTFSK